MEMIRRQQQPQQQPPSQSPQHAQSPHSNHQQAVYRELQMERDRHVIEDKYRIDRLAQQQQQEREDLHRDERRRMEDYFQRSYAMDPNARMERERIEGPHAYVNAQRQGGPRPPVTDDRALTTENLINAIITHNIKSPAEAPMRYVSNKFY